MEDKGCQLVEAGRGQRKMEVALIVSRGGREVWDSMWPLYPEGLSFWEIPASVRDRGHSAAGKGVGKYECQGELGQGMRASSGRHSSPGVLPGGQASPHQQYQARGQ